MYIHVYILYLNYKNYNEYVIKSILCTVRVKPLYNTDLILVIFTHVMISLTVCNGPLTFKMKGRTVMDEHERYEALRHCRYVDEVVPDAPWVLDDEFLTKHKVSYG